MWFASIWIFTLRLDWHLGADFFLRHLMDGDAASNTLSWRWVAGLHTKGKHYLARADNIARYTGERESGPLSAEGLAQDAEPFAGALVEYSPLGRLPDLPGASRAGATLYTANLSPCYLLYRRRQVSLTGALALPREARIGDRVRAAPKPDRRYDRPRTAARFTQGAMASGLAEATRHSVVPAVEWQRGRNRWNHCLFASPEPSALSALFCPAG